MEKKNIIFSKSHAKTFATIIADDICEYVLTYTDEYAAFLVAEKNKAQEKEQPAKPIKRRRTKKF